MQTKLKRTRQTGPIRLCIYHTMWRFRKTLVMQDVPMHTAIQYYMTHSDCLLYYDALVFVNLLCFLPDFVVISDVTEA